MKALYTAIGLLLAFTATAQQVPQYSQYIFNGLTINPAYAGSQEILQVSASHRSQWTGLEGAPTTQTLSMDGAVPGSKVGLGLNIMADKLGAQSIIGVSGSASVKHRISRRANISFGLALGLSQYMLDGTKLNSGGTTTDHAVAGWRETEMVPDVKLGAFYNTERFYAGLSVANLVPFTKRNLLITNPARHLFFTTGYVFDVGYAIRVKPSLLIKEDFKSPTSVDANLFVLFYDKLWLGASYRANMPLGQTNEEEEKLSTKNAVALMTEVYATPKFRIGYSYDITLSSLKNYGSHELSLGYTFLKKRNGRIPTPRYF